MKEKEVLSEHDIECFQTILVTGDFNEIAKLKEELSKNKTCNIYFQKSTMVNSEVRKR